MLKQIVVLTDNKKILDGLNKADKEKKELQIVRQAAADPLPPTAAAALIGEDQVVAGLNIAKAMGNRHVELLEWLSEALDCREAFGPGSSKRVKEHATRFADALGLDVNDRLTLERGALVREIGKLLISNEVLLKKELLTYEEWRTIQQHPNFGADMVALSDALKDTEPIVRRHHECYDGTGYPDGLEKDDIPRLARIMKIVDVYCAMTSPRLYREGASTHQEAVEHLKNESGKHFDPELVVAFLNGKIGQI